MTNIVLTRMKQGHRTVSFPKGTPTLPDRFRGLPAACTLEVQTVVMDNAASNRHILRLESRFLIFA